MERKAASTHLKKCFDEINNRIETDRLKEQKNFDLVQEEQKNKIS